MSTTTEIQFRVSQTNVDGLAHIMQPGYNHALCWHDMGHATIVTEHPRPCQRCLTIAAEQIADAS